MNLRPQTSDPKLAPPPPGVLAALEAEVDAHNVLEALGGIGLAEPPREVRECHSGEEGAGFGVLWFD